eukprot:TRINITY_DN35503_c0_g1_i1.p1 TRINITY_DN35503_c0_g1~~TRINITY_DN35503_c0_g1_i1.p1  ORF type:complete len:257 (-),score=42.20 TRINITY_DN35503_c0_g1_i1:978-1748(-)
MHATPATTSSMSSSAKYLPCLLGRYGIRPPPGLEALGPRMELAHSKLDATTSDLAQASEEMPMFLHPNLTPPVIAVTPGKLTVLMADKSTGTDGDPDISYEDQPSMKFSHETSIGGVSSCSTAATRAEYDRVWLSLVEKATEPPADMEPESYLPGKNCSPTLSSRDDDSPISTTVPRDNSLWLPRDDSEEMPTTGGYGMLSIGSDLHQNGNCKPCDFTRRGGCRAGEDCTFCHLCTPDDAKRKKRERRKLFRQMRK